LQRLEILKNIHRRKEGPKWEKPEAFLQGERSEIIFTARVELFQEKSQMEKIYLDQLRLLDIIRNGYNEAVKRINKNSIDIAAFKSDKVSRRIKNRFKGLTEPEKIKVHRY
jgi:hypothetical protein